MYIPLPRQKTLIYQMTGTINRGGGVREDSSLGGSQSAPLL